MKAIILAGGYGTRLRPVVSDIPKPMAPVAGKPFLEYLILQLKKARIRDIILSVGYMGGVIRSYFSDGKSWDVKIEYVEEREPLGTGGGVREAIAGMDDEKSIVLNGDSFLSVNFGELVRYHENHAAVATMALALCEDTSRYGKVQINERGEVVEFTEKGKGGKGHVNGGVYVVNRSLRKYLPAGKSSLERDVFPRIIGTGLYGMPASGFFIDIGVPEDYRFACGNPHRFVCQEESSG